MTALLGLPQSQATKTGTRSPKCSAERGSPRPELPDTAASVAFLLGQLSNSLGGASAGGILSGGLGELVDRFKQSGQSETAKSCIKPAPTNS